MVGRSAAYRKATEQTLQAEVAVKLQVTDRLSLSIGGEYEDFFFSFRDIALRRERFTAVCYDLRHDPVCALLAGGIVHHDGSVCCRQSLGILHPYLNMRMYFIRLRKGILFEALYGVILGIIFTCSC
jgi:hypothetical protein